MLTVTQIQVEGFDANFSYLITDDESKDVLLVDPCGDIDRVFTVIEKEELRLVGVVITHTHHDHYDALDKVPKDIDIYIYESSQTLIGRNQIISLEDASEINIGGHVINVLHTPGHLHDSICLFITNEHATDGVPKIITGDTLFVEGCGRTNEQDVETLYESLQRLKKLPPETEVYTGHDYGSVPHSTIAHELEHNRFFLTPDFAAFKNLRLPQG